MKRLVIIRTTFTFTRQHGQLWMVLRRVIPHTFGEKMAKLSTRCNMYEVNSLVSNNRKLSIKCRNYNVDKLKDQTITLKCPGFKNLKNKENKIKKVAYG